MHLNLENPKLAYMIGFIMSDGNLYETTRTRGKLSIEIKKQDIEILKEISKLVTCNFSITERTRTTNFKNNYTTACLRICDLEFRKELKRVGVHSGKKFNICSTPLVPYSEIDFWRGIIDGDGSLGITSQSIPFVSLITNSESMAQEYINFLNKHLGKRKTSQRNKRDGNFNIMVTKEDAQKIASLIYYPVCLSLNRKFKKSKEVIIWKRPKQMKKIDFQKKES